MSLDAARLARRLAGASWISRLVVLDTVDSTNDDARRRTIGGAPSGLVVVADHQSAGRGRRGRAWDSPAGTGLYVSVAWTTRAPVSRTTRYTLAAAVAACDACREVAGCPVAIEWPNDLVQDGRKIGGILCELRSAGAGSSELIVGTGINVLDPPAGFAPDVARRATSLARAVGASMIDREELLASYLERLGAALAAVEGPGWPALAARWLALAPRAQGARVRVERSEREASVEGRTDGIDDEGAIRVRCADGRTILVRSVDTLRFEGE